jgi:hypothetical protein
MPLCVTKFSQDLLSNDLYVYIRRLCVSAEVRLSPATNRTGRDGSK